MAGSHNFVHNGVFSLFYYSDRLSVAVTPHNFVEGLHEGRISYRGPIRLTFINSGTRPVGVLHSWVGFVEPSPDDRPVMDDCSGTAPIHAQVDFAPLVVKPYEMATTEMNGSGSFARRTITSPDDKTTVVVCVEFEIATIDDISEKAIVVERAEIMPGLYHWSFPGEWKPFHLVDRTWSLPSVLHHPKLWLSELFQQPATH